MLPLDSVGSKIGGTYNPQTSDFPSASPGVLCLDGRETMIAQNSLDDAVAAMERLIEVYGDRVVNFFSMPIISWAKQKKKKEIKVQLLIILMRL